MRGRQLKKMTRETIIAADESAMAGEIK